ncbi:SDR family oxidoreductase [Pontivivens ytuae]|uniref:SDR family oxidoreductase n=1 Tax=Pontivivens ytuae TaxID=2789856 RepID=A0A7S9QDS4_9RHOB|nr:SDR family oxidoreductase [Pontivivens ytuae]QPH54682.1 SDR family oxidoreductase [Pontivivens ytuae]
MATTMITGASRGIGAELARQAAARGDTVIATMREPSTADLPDGIERHALDVKSEAGQLLLAEQLGNRTIDLLVCNAGVLMGRGGLGDDAYDAAAWEQSMMTNVAGVFFTIRTFLPMMREGAKIGVISSQMGSNARPRGNSYIYRASKAAASNLVTNLAVELAERGIVIGAYHPGWVRTDMGGDGADISTAESARGLLAQFDALTAERSGGFYTWDGDVMPH